MIRAIDKWLIPVLRHGLPGKSMSGPRHILFCMADHFEPFHGGADKRTALDRTKCWVDRYLNSMNDIRDDDGIMPQHTIFYPAEEYDEEVLNALEPLVKHEAGEVEVQLHHNNDSPENMLETLRQHCKILANEHGFLGISQGNVPGFAFVHGNWALCNSRPDGRWCGINNEVSILKNAGCYVDMTFPSAPSPTQPRTVNRPYFISDNGSPRAADYGRLMCVGDKASGDELLLIPGPLCLDWNRRNWGLFPRIENAEWNVANPATHQRVRNMYNAGVSVKGLPQCVVIKMHMHGCNDGVVDQYLGDIGKSFYELFTEKVAENPDHHLHFVSARQLYNITMSIRPESIGEISDMRERGIAKPPIKSTN